MSKPKERREILWGWMVIASLLFGTVLILRWLVLPLLVTPLLGISDIQSDELPSVVRVASVNLSFIIILFSLYHLLSRLLRSFLNERSLWGWFVEIFEQTVRLIEKK